MHELGDEVTWSFWYWSEGSSHGLYVCDVIDINLSMIDCLSFLLLYKFIYLFWLFLLFIFGVYFLLQSKHLHELYPNLFSLMEFFYCCRALIRRFEICSAYEIFFKLIVTQKPAIFGEAILYIDSHVYEAQCNFGKQCLRRSWQCIS